MTNKKTQHNNPDSETETKIIKVNENLKTKEEKNNLLTQSIHDSIAARSPGTRAQDQLLTDSEYGSHEDLFLEVRDFLENHIDLVEEAEYDILTAKVFETWLIDRFSEVGYIFFLGPPRSGKTRALETLASICYNPLIAATMSAAAIYRTLDKGPATLFLDELQQYLQDDKTTFLAVLNAGQRRGQKAILVVRTGDGYDTQGFEVFGPKFMASTEETTHALATRCVPITMVKNTRRVPLRINDERAVQIKNKLSKYVHDIRGDKIPDVEPLFMERGFSDYRNIEAFLNLVAVTPPKFRGRILDYAKQIDDNIAEEDGLNFYSDLYGAVHHAYLNAKGGKISIAAITEAYNDGKEEQEKVANRTVGSQVNIMGLNRKCRMSDGKMGRYISETLMKRLSRRYGATLELSIFSTDGTEESEHQRGVLDTHFIDKTTSPSPSVSSEYSEEVNHD